MAGSLGGLLHAFRLRAALGQRQLAVKAGLSVRAIRDIEHGRVSQPRADSLHRLANALGLSDEERGRLSAAGRAPGGDQVYVEVLGTLAVWRSGVQVELGAMCRRLLAFLALRAGREVAREELVDLLWGDQPPRTAVNLLHGYVREVRAALEPGRPPRTAGTVLVRTQFGYRLDLPPDGTDLGRFNTMVSAARTMSGAAAVSRYGDALGLWRGPVLAGMDDRLRRCPDAAAAAAHRSSTATVAADLAIATGRAELAVGWLRAVSAEEPLHEGLHARMVRALASSGEPAAALRHFSTVRAMLREDLGVDPGAELSAAHREVLRADVPLPAPTVGPAQLPAHMASFVGRTVELGQLDAVLAASGGTALFAVSGGPGTGKTAFVVQWAHRVSDRFPDGQLYVDLRGYAATPPMAPIEALAGFLYAFGVPADRVGADLERTAALYRSVLAGRRMLIVLDNAASADQVRPLLPGRPGCVVVVTSRSRLAGLSARDGAHRVTLDGLKPAEADELLRRIVGDGRVDAEPRAAAELARACGYLPLALRIVAARLADDPGCTVAQRLVEFDRHGRLSALAIDDDPQTAVRAAFDLSYVRLGATQRRMFRLLGVAPVVDITSAGAAVLAGCTDAEARRWLDHLASVHLLVRSAPDRYTLHDLLRLYAAERARLEHDEVADDGALDRLFAWYLRHTDAAALHHSAHTVRLPMPATTRPDVGPSLVTDHTSALAWFTAERANLLAVIRHCACRGPGPVAWQLTDALRGYYWQVRHTVDWLEVTHAGLAAAIRGNDRRAEAAMRFSLGMVNHCLDRYQPAIAEYRHAAVLAERTGWLDGQAAALGYLGVVHHELGDLHEAARCHGRNLAISRRTGRQLSQAIALGNLGWVSQDLGRRRHAVGYHVQALALHRRAGSRSGIANATAGVGAALRRLGHRRAAHRLLTSAVALHRQIGNRYGEAKTMHNLALVHRDGGCHARALRTAEASLALAREIGKTRAEVDIRNALASIQLAMARPHDAAVGFRRVIDLARSGNAGYSHVDAHAGLAAVYLAAGRPARAARHARQARILARRYLGHRRADDRAAVRLARRRSGGTRPSR